MSSRPDDYLLPPPSVVSLPVAGETARFPVRRIYCVGKNYAAHVREMGGDVRKSAPVFFTKSRETLVPDGGDIPYPPMTHNLHHEIELVVAMAGSREIFGYATGLDMTRRDQQAEAKQRGGPWDMAKNFDQAAPCTGLVRADRFTLESARISLSVNGNLRQSACLEDMIWNVEDIIAHLNATVSLAAGDLIFTGTPEGVGPVVTGDYLLGHITGLPTLEVRYV